MGDGISNTQIQNFFENEENADLKNNFVGVFSMDFVTKYIKFHELIKEQKNAKYPFAIFNTDPHNKAGTHWWSFLDIHPKKNLLLFDSHGITGFKYFIVDNDEKIIDELLHDYKKCKSNNPMFEIKLCSMTFELNIWEKMPKQKKAQLNETATYFFHLLYQFGKLKKVNKMTIVIVENDLQKLTSSTCGIFQLYFYKNLLDPALQSSIVSHKNLNVTTIESLLNEIFTVQPEENEHRIKLFKQEFL